MSAGFNRSGERSESAAATARVRFRFAHKWTSAIRRETSWKTICTSASVSIAVHLVILLILSFIYFEAPARAALDHFYTLLMGDQQTFGDDVDVELAADMEPAAIPDTNLGDEEEASDPFAIFVEPVELNSGPQGQTGEKTAPQRQQRTAVTSPAASASKSKENKKAAASPMAVDQHGDHFAGRSGAAKGALLRRMGGSDASEAAVARGLVWLKNHQRTDGSWSFNHAHSPECNCTMPGMLGNNPNGATAMALLAFLGAGQTHEEGQYQSEVRRGIQYLLQGGTPVGKGICFYGNLQGPPTYYTHGLVTIALSEAFAMTHDAEIRPAVAGAIEFLAATQHNQGGWRYFPGQPGDTSVVAWELMALKSAQFSRIQVSPKVFGGIERFLGSVGSMRGSQYAYMPERKNNPTPSMTAAGLLCRMYLNWNETSGGLRAGVHFLDEHGPEPGDMYYNYYATQVLHHWGGEEWNRWNRVMRDHLVNTQVRRTHADGSWDVADRHGNMGGRLYMTSLALLTLEVYYRHLPLYQRDRIEVPLNPAAPADTK